MYGMPLSQALLFLASIIVFVVATTRWRWHPFVVMVPVASAFGYIAGYPVSQLGSVFGSGFSEKIYAPGLVIVAASLVAGIAEATGAADRLTTSLARWRQQRPWLGSRWMAGFLGLIAGMGASAAVAFALLGPLLRPIGGSDAPSRRGATVTLALAISASHGLLVLAPVPIAALAIVGADWSRVALFGLPLGLLVVAATSLWAGRLPIDGAAAEPALAEPALVEPEPGAAKPSGWSALVLVVAIAVPLLLLMEQSLGDIPSEPLGGGPARELVIGVGRPLILFLVGVGIMIIGQPRPALALLADPVWTGRMFGRVAAVLLLVCAAGGLQRLCQNTGMAEMVGEHMLAWPGGALGVLVPFLIAAAVKTLQGSSLVAAITAAGMVQPVLLTLGLGDANGKALAALAIGAGAMTVSHINDDYFWLVAQSAGLTPLRGLAAIGLGTLLQGLLAAAALVILALLFVHA